MRLNKESKAEIATKFGGKAANTGAAEVQIALLTERINHITGHLTSAPKDKSSGRGLIKLVGERKRLLHHLHDTNLTSYRQLIDKLGLRK
ncbi:MAG TPA: 30S ribosomal protein S15 [Bacteroidetes bacterium]|nr:30S ribosomal protein S15 [Bacteroidota bacterium]